MIALLDLQVLARENAGRGFKDSEPTYGVLACLRCWEILISRMEDGWPRQDYYMVDEYLLDLGVRDRIESFLSDMPSSLRTKVGRCVERLDTRFRAVTREDNGAELSKYWLPLAEGSEVRWWWTRCPTELPPGW
ncbi:hypothetical protein [Actinomadura oligospora]|uniref:hypothetical protein n=1 Tax=Actinomadura oligospora TaxID=111804 RepID=UPI0004AE45A3|nr:hypothetical protein [Actinomadura oligospora]